jgi:formiminoglutamase
MTSLHHDPNWPRASDWLRGLTTGAALGPLSVIGVPIARSITPGRCDLGPPAIRAALDRFSTYDFTNGLDVRDLAVTDFGDLGFPALQTAIGPMVLLGGDNSITYPAVAALGDSSLITFDAHLDLRDTDRGLTNGNPIRALLEDGYPGDRITQIGIQSFANSAAYAEVARRAGIHLVTAEEVHARGIAPIVEDALDRAVGPVYIDLDVDVLDRAFSPATPGSRPGGLFPWQLRIAARMCGTSPKVRAMDLVEIDPTKDIADTTCLAAASFLLSFASGVLERCSQSQTAHKS